MDQAVVLVLTFGAALAAALVGLLGDMLDRGRAWTLPAAVLLLAGGVVEVYAGWTVKAAPTLGGFMTGGVFSVVPGLALVTSAFALLGARRMPRPGQATALVALGVLGAGLAAASTDLVSMLVGIEVAAVCAYALVTSSKSARSAEASLKYFVQGSVATGLFVLGIAALVGAFAPDARLSSVVSGIGSHPELASVAVLGSFALVSAVSFKVGAAPFHSWAPDAYETAPAPAAAFLAGALKLAMITVLAGVVTSLASAGASAERPYGILLLPVFGVLGGLALLSIVVGSTIALTTSSYRRMLGYAGVAQVGYALIALAALNPSGAVLFVATYAVASTAAFLSAEAFARLLPDWDGTVDGLAGAGRRSPVLGASLTLALMSLAGIPPLLGFWGKLQAFGAAISGATLFSSRGLSGFSGWLAFLAVVGILGSVVSLGYYGRVVRVLFFGTASDAPAETTLAEAPKGGAGLAGAAVVTLALLVIVLGLVPVFAGIPASVQGFLLG